MCVCIEREVIQMWQYVNNSRRKVCTHSWMFTVLLLQQFQRFRMFQSFKNLQRNTNHSHFPSSVTNLCISTCLLISKCLGVHILFICFLASPTPTLMSVSQRQGGVCSLLPLQALVQCLTHTPYSVFVEWLMFTIILWSRYCYYALSCTTGALCLQRQRSWGTQKWAHFYKL